MKKYIFIIIIASLIFLAIVFIFDIVNITQYIPLSKQYDWLGFIGTYIGSIIGAIVTLFGVYQTIQYEKEKDREKDKMDKKPYFYSVDPMSDYDYKNTAQFILSEDASYKDKKYSEQIAIIKNTDNAILIIDHISINNINYYPALGEVIDKNQIVYLELFSNDDIEINDITLYVKDILGNIYTYLLAYNVQDKKIIQLKEI